MNIYLYSTSNQKSADFVIVFYRESQNARINRDSYIFFIFYFCYIMQALQNYGYIVTILRSKEGGFYRKRSNVLCQRIASRKVDFFQLSSNRRKNAAAIFRCSRYVHRDTYNSTRHDATTRSTGRSFMVSPLRKIAGAIPILADGKSA